MTEEQGAKDRGSRLAAIGVVVVGWIVGLVVGQFAREALAEAVGYSVSIVMLMAWFFWAELERRWFWCFMSIVVVAHALALRLIPWPVAHRANKGDILIGLGDLFLMGLVGLLVRQLARRAETTRSEA